MSKRTIGVLGLGIFGTEIVNSLSCYNCDIIAVDNREDHINPVGHCLTQGVVGDITDFALLQAAGIDTCDVVIISTGTSLEASVLAVMHCKTLGVPKVIAKATNEIAAQVLTKIGADKVITPEKEMGKALAKQVLYRSTVGLFNIDKQVSIIEFYPPKMWLGKTLLEVNPRKSFKINLIGFRSSANEQLNVDISPDYVFQATEAVIAVTDSQSFDRFAYLTQLDND